MGWTDPVMGFVILVVILAVALLLPTVPWRRLRAPIPATPEAVEPSPMACTYCGGTSFYEGPSGGASTNVLCAEPSCRHWFNVCPEIGYMDDLHRIEPIGAGR